MRSFSPEECHWRLMDKTVPCLRYAPSRDYDAWRREVRERLAELLGDRPDPVDANLVVEYENDCDFYTEKRFVFRSEQYADVPCYLLIPKTGSRPFPVVICLQGHSSGMHFCLVQGWTWQSRPLRGQLRARDLEVLRHW